VVENEEIEDDDISSKDITGSLSKMMANLDSDDEYDRRER